MLDLPSAPPERIEFTSTDLCETREFLGKNYGWRVAVEHPDKSGKALTVSMTQAGFVTLGHARAPGDLSYLVTGEDFVVFDTLFEGTFEIGSGEATGHYGPGDVFIANHPRAEFRSRTRDIRVLTTTLPSAVLEEAANDDPGGASPPIEFLSNDPIDGAARRWRAAARFVDRLLNDFDVGSAPLIVGSAGRMLAATALATFPNTATLEETCRDRNDAQPDALRRATSFIEANPDRDISLGDIARAAHVSRRAVQLAFRRHLDTTPMAYLRQVRLACAHEDLLEGEDALTVAAVAYRWGFSSPSRFSQQYRALYGSSPSATLHDL